MPERSPWCDWTRRKGWNRWGSWSTRLYRYQLNNCHQIIKVLTQCFVSGLPGVAGQNGKDGVDGKDGKDGTPGAAGPPGKLILFQYKQSFIYEIIIGDHLGPQGADDADGSPGSPSTPGKDGQDGAPGVAGAAGAAGPVGTAGAGGAGKRNFQTVFSID